MKNLIVKPAYNYGKVFETLRGQLLEIPTDVVDFAYAFRDFCQKHFGEEDYSHQMEIKRYFPFVGGFFGGGTPVRYLVRVNVETRSVYHNDTQTNYELTIRVLTPYTAGFDSPKHYPWERK